MDPIFLSGLALLGTIFGGIATATTCCVVRKSLRRMSERIGELEAREYTTQPTTLGGVQFPYRVVVPPPQQVYYPLPSAPSAPHVDYTYHCQVDQDI